MMFRKLSSSRLLVHAEKAEATADRALVVAQKARNKAARQRVLAARIEAEEEAVRLEKKAAIADLLMDKANQAFYLALSENNKAKGMLDASQQSLEQASQMIEECEARLKQAESCAQAARAGVPVTESAE